MMPSLVSLLGDERKAISAYGKAAPFFRRRGENETADLMRHIQGEEKEHARELTARMKKIGSVRNIGRKGTP